MSRNGRKVSAGEVVLIRCEGAWIEAEVIHLNLESKNSPDNLAVRPLVGQGQENIIFFVGSEEYFKISPTSLN